MKEIDLQDLSIENIGEWPIAIKILIVAVLCVVILFAGYWFSTGPQLQELDKIKNKHLELRKKFENKQHLASNLEGYKKQLVEIEGSFGSMLKQLPSLIEVPALLEEISETGNATGLGFNLIKPSGQNKHDFYAELPIKIEVNGDYHQFGHFVGRLARSQRIITLHNFSIGAHDEAETSRRKAKKSDGRLSMEITAKTYRYLDSSR